MEDFIRFAGNIPFVVWIFVGTCLGVFIYACLSIHKELTPISNELKQIASYLNDARRKGAVDEAGLEAMKNYLEGFDYFGESWEEFEETLVTCDKYGERLVFNTQRASTFINSEMLIYRHINANVYEAVPSILTGIGLIGTFVAIIWGLSSLQFDHTSGQVGNVNEFIESLGGKFVSSVVGLGCSLLFLSIEKHLLGVTVNTCLAIQTSLDRLFPQRVIEEIVADIQTSVEEQSNTMRHFNSELAIHLKQSFQESLVPTMERMVLAIDQLLEVTEELRKQKEESAGHLVDRIVENFKSSLTDHASHELDQLRLAVANTSTFANDLNSRVEGLLAHSETVLKTQQQQAAEHFLMVEDKISTMLSNVDTAFEEQNKRTIEGLSSVSNAFSTLAREIKESTTDFVEQLRTSVSDMITDNRSWSEEFRNSFDQSMKTQTELNHSLQERIKESIYLTISTLETAFDDHLDKVGSRIDGLLEKVTAWTEESTKDLSTYASSLAGQSSAMVAAGESIRAASGELDNMFQEQKEFLGSLKEAISTFGSVSSKVTESAERIATLQETSQEGIRTLTTEINRNASMFKDAERLMNTQKEVYEALDGGISKSLQSINQATREYAEHTRESLGTYLSEFDKHLSDAVGQLDGTVHELEEAMGDLSDVIAKTINSIKANSNGAETRKEETVAAE